MFPTGSRICMGMSISWRPRTSIGEGMADTILITDCDMGEPDLERAILEAAGFRLVEAQCTSESDVIASVAQTGAVGLLVQYAPITRRVLESCPDVRGVCLLYTSDAADDLL